MGVRREVLGDEKGVKAINAVTEFNRPLQNLVTEFSEAYKRAHITVLYLIINL